MKNLAFVLVLVLMATAIYAGSPRINNSQGGAHPEFVEPQLKCRLVKLETPNTSDHIQRKGYKMVYLCEQAITRDGNVPGRDELNPGKNSLKSLKRADLN